MDCNEMKRLTGACSIWDAAVEGSLLEDKILSVVIADDTKVLQIIRVIWFKEDFQYYWKNEQILCVFDDIFCFICQSNMNQSNNILLFY